MSSNRLHLHHLFVNIKKASSSLHHSQLRIKKKNLKKKNFNKKLCLCQSKKKVFHFQIPIEKEIFITIIELVLQLEILTTNKVGDENLGQLAYFASLLLTRDKPET